MAISDKEQKALGKVVTFGVDSISKPTPLFMKYTFRAFMFLSGVWALLPQDLLHLTDTQLATTNRWLIVGNTVMLFAIKFFSWDYKSE